ncbi:MAG TPA: copper chaperone PCu(A)C [Burkholderiales bacterium]|nr:copper chaperone PCu(A)C [Burkholderiales bacterium]
MKAVHYLALCAGLTLAGAAWAQKKGELEIDHPWARATPPGASVGGGYVTVRNAGDGADRLIGASSPAADHVELHIMAMDNGVMRMRQVPSFKVPAHGQLMLKPGGNHLMFLGLKQPLEPGERVPVKLRFEKAGEVEVQLEVGPMGASAPMPMHK